MIDTKDLMIGNWVLDNDNKTVQVMGMNPDGIAVYIPNTKSFRVIIGDWLNPIPLSLDLVKRLGFEVDDFTDKGLGLYVSRQLPTERHFCLSFDVEDGIICTSGGLVTQIKYLHQLQNFWYLLTNTQIYEQEKAQDKSKA